MVPLSQSLYCTGLAPADPLARNPQRPHGRSTRRPLIALLGRMRGRMMSMQIRHHDLGISICGTDSRVRPSSSNRSPRSTILRRTRSLDRPRPSYSGIGSGSSPSQRYCTLTPVDRGAAQSRFSVLPQPAFLGSGTPVCVAVDPQPKSQLKVL